MTANRMRQEISRLMKMGDHDYEEEMDQELDMMSGRLRTVDKAENADHIKLQKQRSLNPAGFLCAIQPETAKQIIITADAIAAREQPEDAQAANTWSAANKMLESLFDYYTQQEEDGTKDA